jgi:hypothetical protein
MNNWDKELVEFKLHSKMNCTKFKTCHIKWSPEVGFWLSRRWLLARVKVYVMGLGPPDSCNLIRDCLRSHLFDPRCISYSDVMIQTEIVHHKLSELAKDAPALSHQNLLDLQKTGIQLARQSYLRYSPKNKRKRNGVELITRLNHHKEAIPLQSMFNVAQLSINMTLSRQLWITPQTICLNVSVWLILHRATTDNYSTT